MPDTPPAGKGKPASVADILGLKALGLFKDRDFVVFAMTSLAIMFAGLFYWNFANVYLNESNVKAAQSLQSIGQMVEMVFLFVMPWFFARFGVKKMLLLGLCAWIARFICFSNGNWEGGTAALVVIGLMLHGPCYDFFFVTGQLYTDKKASKDIQAQAQGLISLITFGIGWFFGSMLSGSIVDQYAIKDAAGKVTGHNWPQIWMWPVGIVAALIVFFVLFFRDNSSVGVEEGAAAPAEKPAEGVASEA
jgi:MFS family permease